MPHSTSSSLARVASFSGADHTRLLCAAGVWRCGCSSTQAAAAKIRANPTMSAKVSRSPRMIIEPITPTTGLASVPSEAVAVETLPMMLYQMK